MSATADRCILSVHAHPDDEASKGAATVSRYVAEGVRSVLVTCTGGEEGEILNPAMDRDDVREQLHAYRMSELGRSVEIIGYHELVLLGYRDSGMPGSPANEHPNCFAQAPLDEAVGRLVAAIREHRPQVILTYGDDQEGYPHPDHLRVHEITVLAFDQAGDPAAYPELGEPWQPSKLYYNVWSMVRMEATFARMEALGLELPPFVEEFRSRRPPQEHRITTTIDLGDHVAKRRLALLAHRTQVDPAHPMWFGLPEEEADRIHPFEEYTLARSLVDSELPETDLFAGIVSATE